jgi:hypothetical protein
MKIIKYSSIGLLILVLVTLTLFTTVDRTPLEQTSHYKKTISKLDSTDFNSHTGEVLAGWGKLNITPEETLPLAGFGDRWGALSTGIKDSVYLRCLWLENEKHTSIIISGDLLIFPPELHKLLSSYLKKEGYSYDNLYVSASHTHSSFGSWAPGIVGQLIAGDYSEEVLNTLFKQIVSVMDIARKELLPAEISYTKSKFTSLFNNRIVGQDGIINPWLKSITFKRSDQSKLLLVSFPSHPTIYSSDNLEISGDYPGELMNLIDNSNSYDIGIFLAGPMGSMGRPFLTADKTENIKQVAKLLMDSILAKKRTYYPINKLGSKQFTFELGDPQMRISESIRARPWVFRSVFGKPKVYLSTLKINDLVMISTPCDFSGEIAFRLDSSIAKSNQSLMINSFNGSYIGYITEDKWYDRPTYETRDMNWFGPYNGRYFSELISTIAAKYD